MTPLHLPFRGTVLVLAALAASIAVAACGSSSSSSTNTSASSGGSTTTSTTASRSGFNRTSFETCLKQHGVTLPHRAAGTGAPPSGGGFFGGGGAPGSGSGRGGFFANNPKMAAAVKACGGGNFRGRAGGRFRLSHAKIQQYVTCVRQHGYPQMPDANFSGKGPVFPADIRSNPKFQAASRDCQSILVPARPGGTGGTSTVSPS